MPWENNDFFDRNDDTIQFHIGRYHSIQNGTYKTQKEIHDAERENHEDTVKAWNRKVPTLPNNLYGFDENKYATSHRCFGEQCPVEPPKSDRYAMRPVIQGQSLL